MFGDRNFDLIVFTYKPGEHCNFTRSPERGRRNSPSCSWLFRVKRVRRILNLQQNLHGHLLRFVLILTVAISGAWGGNQDSLSYNFHRENLSTINDLRLNYELEFDRSTFLINDILRYKVYDYESSIAAGKQYSIEHKLRGDLLWGKQRHGNIRLESSQYQDHRTGLASVIKSWALLGGVQQRDLFSLFLGARSVERFGIVDQGWTTQLDLNKTWNFGPQRSTLLITGQRDQLNRHLNHLINSRAGYSIRFADVSNFQSSLQFENRRQEFFTDSLGSSQVRNNKNVVWKNHFSYDLGKDLQLFHDLNWGDQSTGINQEKIDENSSISLPSVERKRLSLVNETGLILDRPHFFTISAFKIENSQNKYYVDYTQILYQFREDMVWTLPGFIDSMVWKNTLSRLEYDTPDTNNDDDRDEWRLKTEVSFVWEPNPFYTLELGTKLSLFHLIYLFNTRSSENYWNRNLVLWSRFKWRRNAFTGEGWTNIRSNYFDYDYDELFIESDQPTRSFVHRSLDLGQQLNYRFDRRFSMVTKIALRWEDEGQLDWDRFIEQVSSEREQIEVSSRISFDYKGWQGWIGYLVHRRRTDYTAANRDPDLWFGKGPLIGVKHNLGNKLFFELDARFIGVEDRGRNYMLPKIFLTLVLN